MEKVYVLLRCQFSDTSVLDVFATSERAVAEIRDLEPNATSFVPKQESEDILTYMVEGTNPNKDGVGGPYNWKIEYVIETHEVRQ